VLGKNMEQGQELDVIRVFLTQGVDCEAAIWDQYSTFFEDRRSLKGNDNPRLHVNGWTSWYNYYGDVSEKIINENVDALTTNKYPIDIFQIDDGFQTAIGDWLSINKKFPSGMKVVADKVKGAGFKAGLWLAPYAVGFTSRIVKEHPDWLIVDPDTKKPVVAGPNWGGFYALDMYNSCARAYLKEVFDTVLQDWGFDMLKLDFCFAAAMIPRLGKTRGEIMWEAMELIRDLVGTEKLILGCGVPLAAAFRKVDYCRIGSDVAPWWEGMLGVII
jgi:alpha-galactosidase